jgi:hypothetical protein
MWIWMLKKKNRICKNNKVKKWKKRRIKINKRENLKIKLLMF